MTTSGRHQGAGSRYGRRLAIGFVAYATLLVAGILMAQAIPDSPWRFVAMLLPVPALVIVVAAVWRYLRDADELQGRMLLESLEIGFAGGSLITLTWGLMQAVGAPAVSWTLVFPVYAACWLIGRAVAGWRFR
ncbi:MAG: hypothetical protein L0G99_02685 [Propionibacteriales bacterium]|nr:hypothetical protein [Propionibacteriales bacterium]